MTGKSWVSKDMYRTPTGKMEEKRSQQEKPPDINGHGTPSSTAARANLEQRLQLAPDGELSVAGVTLNIEVNPGQVEQGAGTGVQLETERDTGEGGQGDRGSTVVIQADGNIIPATPDVGYDWDEGLEYGSLLDMTQFETPSASSTGARPAHPNMNERLSENQLEVARIQARLEELADLAVQPGTAETAQHINWEFGQLMRQLRAIPPSPAPVTLPIPNDSTPLTGGRGRGFRRGGANNPPGFVNRTDRIWTRSQAANQQPNPPPDHHPNPGRRRRGAFRKEVPEPEPPLPPIPEPAPDPNIRRPDPPPPNSEVSESSTSGETTNSSDSDDFPHPVPLLPPQVPLAPADADVDLLSRSGRARQLEAQEPVVVDPPEGMLRPVDVVRDPLRHLIDRVGGLNVNAGRYAPPPHGTAQPAVAGVAQQASIIPARTNGSATDPQVKAGGKVGDHSVDTRNVVETAPSFGTDQGQDIITQIRARIRGATTNVLVVPYTVRIQFDWIMPRHADVGNHPNARTQFHRQHRRMALCPAWRITWDPPLITAEVEPTVAAVYCPNNVVNQKQVTATLRGALQISNEVCNAMCTLPLDNRYRFSLVGLFLVGHIIHELLYWFELGGVQPHVGEQEPDAITLFNTNAAGNAAPAMIAVLVEAINTRRIPIHRRFLTDMDINVLRALARGTDYFQLANQGQFFIHQRIGSAPIHFLVYQDDAVALPAAGVPTADDFVLTLQKLARILNAEDDYVLGWTRAQTIVNGKLVVLEGDLQFISVGLEVERVTTPAPIGCSMIWQQLTNSWRTIDVALGLRAEYDELVAERTVETIRIGAALAALYGLGVSSYLNTFNLGGIFLCRWARRAAEYPADAMAQIIRADVTSLVPPICRAGTSLVTSMTGFVLSWRPFRTQLWCGGMVHRNGQVPDDTLWGQVWQLHVPYVVRPEAMAWLFSSLLSVWGLSGPYPGIDIAPELIIGVEVALQVLAVFKGDSSWSVVANSKSPYLMRVYGAFCINTIRQHFRVGAVWQINWQEVRQATDGSVMVEAGYNVDPRLQPLYDVRTFTMVPGTYITFNWLNMRSLLPNILRATIGDNLWPAIRELGKEPAALSGIPLRHPSDRTVINANRFDFSPMLGGAANQAAPANGAGPNAPPMEN